MVKKLISVIMCAFIVFSFTACNGMSTSNRKYNEISDYVLDNIDTLSSKQKTEFFDYEATGLSIGGVYYGYYYTDNNEVLVPDFYLGNNLGERYEGDGGTYFGKPNNGTDWCFVKQITNNWFYYELHWG